MSESRREVTPNPLCIGFGVFEGRCTNRATVLPALLWCDRCEELRIEHLDGQFAAISKSFREGPDGPS